MINNKIPWPVEINARGNSIDFADELLAEIKKHIKGGHGALKAAVNSFKELARNQFTTSEEFIDALKFRYKAICDLNGDPPPLHVYTSPHHQYFISSSSNHLSASTTASFRRQRLTAVLVHHF
ncbi:hypothetical protein N7530_012185 [Penicillium desertorum]|uniref:Uncharacterized protein n=1 Tax=Penicillium desertorum TaxID=1303715 RepID=A0A9X0BGB2_9EURO|nr:hypothetical protein N7530_012185 [Penicillium desertorum]